MQLIKADRKLVRVDTRKLGRGQIERTERYGRSHVLSELNRPITDEEFETLEIADIWRPEGRTELPPTICFYVKEIEPRWVACISSQENNEGDIVEGEWRPVGQPFASKVVSPIGAIPNRRNWFMTLPGKHWGTRAWLEVPDESLKPTIKFRIARHETKTQATHGG